MDGTTVTADWTLRAVGGVGRATTWQDGPGGGGGGRIKLFATTLDFTAVVDTAGGVGQEGGDDGDPGTVHTGP